CRPFYRFVQSTCEWTSRADVRIRACRAQAPTKRKYMGQRMDESPFPGLVRRAVVAGLLAAVVGSALGAEPRVGYTQDALTLDPANHRKRETETIIRNLYDGIMTQTAKSDVVPELAESLRQVDALTYEAKLRSGVKFHSGDEMTADDIK